MYRWAMVAGRLCDRVAARAEVGVGWACGSEAVVLAAAGWSAAMASTILGVEGSSPLSSLPVWWLQSRRFMSVVVPVVSGGGGVVEAVSGKAEAGRVWAGRRRLEFVRVGGGVEWWYWRGGGATSD